MNKDRTKDNSPKELELSEKDLNDVAGGYISPTAVERAKINPERSYKMQLAKLKNKPK